MHPRDAFARGASALALALAGCAAAPPAAPPGPACCASLAEVPARPLAPGAVVELRLDAASPRLDLPGGRSPVALFRLPDAPRPLALDLTSRQAAGPGTLGGMFLAPLGPATVHAFAPALLLLDRERRVVRTVAAQGDTERCAMLDFAGTRVVLRMHVPIVEPAQDVAFLLVATTDAQRAQTSKPCPAERVVFGDAGRLELHLQPLPWDDGALRLSSAVAWQPDMARLGLFADAWAELAGTGFGRLMLGERHLAFARDRGAGLATELALPLARIAAVDAADHSLSVLVRDGDGTARRWHTFVFERRPRAPDASPSQFEAELVRALQADQIAEDIGLDVASWPAAVGFQLLAPKRSGSGALARIGEDATVAGIATALPCGLCAAGGCGPELLVPCAAAFSVGALIGGTVSLGRELLTGGLRPAPPAQAGPPAAEAALGPLGGARSRLDAPALAQCIVERSRREDGDAWRHQGLTARLRPLPTEAGAAIRHRTEVQVDAVTLVATGNAPDAQAPARLRIGAQVRMTDLQRGDTLARPIGWTGAERSLGAWAALAPAELAAELREACDALAGQALAAMRSGWQTQRATAR